MGTELLSALVQRSKQVADPIAQAYASGNRAFQVRLIRPHVTATFDRDSSTFVNPPDETLYEGPARFWPGGQGVELEIGDERTSFTSARCSINLYDGKPPRVDDLVEVLDTRQSRATHLAGRVFSVSDVEVGGHFSTGYTLTLSGAAPSRRT